jgi:hypothetical protein
VDPCSCLSAGDGVRWNQQACCFDPEVKGVGDADVDVHALEDLADLAAGQQPSELAGNLPASERQTGEVVGQVVLEHPSRIAQNTRSVLSVIHRALRMSGVFADGDGPESHGRFSWERAALTAVNASSSERQVTRWSP